MLTAGFASRSLHSSRLLLKEAVVKTHFIRKYTIQFDYAGRPIQTISESDGQPLPAGNAPFRPRGRLVITDLCSSFWEPS